MDFLMHFTEERFRTEVKEIVTEVVKQVLEDSLNGPDNPKPVTFLTRDEAANILKVSLPTLSKLTKEGRIKGYKIGRHIRYKSNELDSALQEIQSYKYKRS